ncbi:hypothetical protein EV14_1389 [Prochlorococcus sp. MIT 0703]|nr:hypothetical protein EV12_0421 [Prochlorococcus sp. MIT 0701]KGG34295.1 hypothetical protein EV14_1389 [Prochlorococcus sp. MIT 0703]
MICNGISPYCHFRLTTNQDVLDVLAHCDVLRNQLSLR